MALCGPIQFRKLDALLTDREFYGTFCKSIGRKLIVSVLYEHFKNNLDAAKAATKIQSNILRKREDIPDESSSVDCVDQLPSYLIAKCASWLQHKDYFHFGHCNRTIYYSVFSPPTIQKFHLKNLVMDAECTLAPFKNISKLTLDISYFNQLSLSKRKTWQKNTSLKTLQLECPEDRPLTSTHEQTFLENVRFIHSDSVRHLTVRDFEREQTVLETLSHFDQIEYLQIDGCRRIYKADLQRYNDLKLSNLRDLHLWSNYGISSDSNDCREMHFLINLTCHQLESLAIHRGELLPSLQETMRFPVLKSFDCGRWDDSCFRQLEETTTLESTQGTLKFDHIDPFMKLMSKQKSLRKSFIRFRSNESGLGKNLPIETLNEIEKTLIKYDAAIGSMKNVSIKFGCFRDFEINLQAFGAQICRLFKVWQSKATSLKMTVCCAYIDVKGAGLFVLNELKSQFSVEVRRSAVTIMPIQCGVDS